MNIQQRPYSLHLILASILCLLYFFTEPALAGSWRLDAPGEEVLPRNLRLSSDDFTAEDSSLKSGLSQLCISGSAQPSAAGFTALYQQLRAQTSLPIYMVDLREESHGFLAGVAISWYEDHNWGNRGKPRGEMLQDEQQRLHSLTGPITAIPLGREDTARLSPQTLPASTPADEAATATAAGFHYVRLPATDQCWPEPAVIDDFLQFYRTLPASAWLHFHCQAGHGRTTTFMVLYDILQNPELPLETIVLRQQLLGGTYLLAEPDGTDWLSVETRRKAQNLRLFYRYVQQEKPQQFPMPWANWLAAQTSEN